MIFLLSFLLVVLLGGFHALCLRGLSRLADRTRRREWLHIPTVFTGLLTIHTVEILLFALIYRFALSLPGAGGLNGDFQGSWQDLVYFSGINFTTLGYTQIETSGSIRMVSMMEALGGFMVLTWSATFIFAEWQKVIRA